MEVKEIERSIITTYRKKIWVPFIKGINDYKLIKENDKIAVCISGGKDSFLLAKCMQEIKRHGKINFELEFIVMDPGYTEKNRQKIIDNAKLMDIPIHIVDSTTIQLIAKCMNWAKHREQKAAAKMQIDSIPLVKALFSEVNPIPVKAALNPA